MPVVTAQQLEELCGYEFDPGDILRAEATISFIVTAAEGIVGQTIDEDAHPLVVAAITASCVRHMHNQSGASTETIGGFTAQWANAGRIFSNEETAMLRSARGQRVGTINLRVPPTTGDEIEQ
jgi:hypothetical protein